MDNKQQIIQAQKLTKRFDDFTAVDGLEFSVNKGDVFAFIGPSGCGKTTTIRMLVGTYRPTEGSVTVWGKSPDAFSRAERERIGYMPQLFVLYPELTVWENLNFAASLYGFPWRRKKRLEELLDLVELTGHERKRVKEISGGMQRRLSLASTLVHRPELMFLDEPTAGIDPILRRKIWEYFGRLTEEGHTLFITTQFVEESSRADQVGLMSQGRLLAVETPLGLRRLGLGGDLIHIRTTSPISAEIMRAVEALSYIMEATRLDNNALELLVEEAESSLPRVLNWFEERDFVLEAANEHQPPYEDVFVRIIEAHQITQEQV